MNKPAFGITHIALAIVAFVTFTCAACAGVVSLGGTADLAAGVDENWTPGTSWFMLGISAFFALVTFALVTVIVIDLRRKRESHPARSADEPPADDRPWERDKGPEDWPRDPLGS
jgi:heme/copper-type cytochrome/quinol oxidase subunit 2